MGFSRQNSPEYWSGLPFSFPGDLPNPGIEPASPVAPELAGRFFTTEPPGKPPDQTTIELHVSLIPVDSLLQHTVVLVEGDG